MNIPFSLHEEDKSFVYFYVLNVKKNVIFFNIFYFDFFMFLNYFDVL
jgi:hypothetical protein